MSQFSGATFGRYAGFWLLLTGIFELVLAGVFVAIGMAAPVTAFGMFLTAAVLGAVGIGCVLIGLRARSAARATDRLLAAGVTGRALVTGATQTGMYLNNQPRMVLDLSVELPGRPAYRAQHKGFVPLMLLHRVAPGSVLPVRADPAEPQRLAIDWQAAVASAPIGAQLGEPGSAFGQPAAALAAARPGAVLHGARASYGATVDESLSQVQAALAASGASAPAVFQTAQQGDHSVEQLRDHLRQHGIAGTAVIDSLSDTGQIVGNERVYTMSVTLELPGQQPRALPASAAMVPIAQMHSVRVGARVPVRVAADNHNLAMFEWDRLQPPGQVLV